VEALFHDLVIGVTRFFRDPRAFGGLEKQVLPRLPAASEEGKLRVWVPACSPGEEAHSLAILFQELAENRRKPIEAQIRAGARSPIAALVHAAVVLASMVLLAPLLAYLPMASLAALLLLVAWNMAEIRHIAHMLRVAPRSDVFVLVVCFVLTVAFDMVVAVSVGIVLAALLLMRRMAEITHSRVLQEDDGAETSRAIPPGVALYEIAGVLFFGAAEQAMKALSAIGSDIKVVVLGLGRVSVIDASGLVALESALERLRRERKFVIITGPLPEPRRIFERAELEANLDHVLFAHDVDAGLQIAADLAALNPDWNSARIGERRP